MSTFAGTGLSGNRDGSLAQATFGTPSGLATSHDGDVYVVDKALNTLRVIHAGYVRTLVGKTTTSPELWIAGGYTDGPASAARFNHPEGVAVGPNGAVYVADTLNLCVRKFQHGNVTTVAGAPGRWGSQDGTSGSASFKYPVALTVDDHGNIFVADEGNGVRQITPAGAVTTLPIKTDSNVSALSIGTGSLGTFLYVADDEGIARYNFADRSTERTDSTVEITRLSTMQGSNALGFPEGIAALSDREVVFTDARNDTIGYLHDNYVRVVAGVAAHDPSNYAGGYKNGVGGSARFNAPLAITATGDDGFLIADAGNHRIRKMSNFDRHYYVTPAADNLDQYMPNSDRQVGIAYVGNSLSWTDSTWSESIAGQFQNMLNRGSRQAQFRVVPVTSPGADLTSLSSLAIDLLSDTSVKYILLQYNSAFVSNYGKISYASLLSDTSWEKRQIEQLAALNKALAAKGIKLIVLLQPYGYEIAPSESTQWQRIVHFKVTQKYPDAAALHRQLDRVLQSSGVTFGDAWSTFSQAEERGEGPLFGNFDPHMSYRGRSVMAQYAYSFMAHILRAR